MNHHSKTWSLQDAKAKFSEVVRRARTEGPQIVTLHGEAVVTITAITNEKKISELSGADLIAFLRKGPFFDFDLPPRPNFSKEEAFSFEDEENK